MRYRTGSQHTTTERPILFPRQDPLLEKVRAICLALPDAHETTTSGKPHIRVKDNILCGDTDDSSAPRTSDSTGGSECARAIRAKDWPRVRAMIVDNYRMIAPNSSLARLDAPRFP